MPSEQTKHNLSGETGRPSNPMADPAGPHRGVTLHTPLQQVGHLYGDRGLSLMTAVLLSLPRGQAALRVPRDKLPIRNPTQLPSLPASVVSFTTKTRPLRTPAPHHTHTHRTSWACFLLADQVFHFLWPSETGRGWRPQRHSRESSNLASVPPRKRGFVRIKLGNGHKAPATWHSIKHSYYYFMVAVT